MVKLWEEFSVLFFSDSQCISRKYQLAETELNVTATIVPVCVHVLKLSLLDIGATVAEKLEVTSLLHPVSVYRYCSIHPFLS